jgi:broad specificity phosphatase PhoE
MRLVLVRHGETEHNRKQLTLGRFDAPLNERGRAQAEAVAGAFDAAPDVIYASPLSRALEMAKAIGTRSGASVVIEADLIEMDAGDMEHLTSGELRERHPEFLRAWLSRDVAEARMPGGETLREVQERAWALVERWRGERAEGDVVAVTHNFVIRTLVCRALGLPLAEFRRLRHGLAARTVLEIGEDGGALLLLNDQSHLIAAGLGDDLRRREART